jgi:hypothetical protein
MTHLSSKLPADWRCDVTLFNGNRNPIPSAEHVELTFPQLVELVAQKILVCENKANVPYFVLSRLRVSEYVGKTRERAIREGWPREGKQRSASHVVGTTAIVADLDGITLEQLAEIKDRLKTAGSSYLLYSSHSYGRPDKPGVCARLIVPVDRYPNPSKYKGAAQAFNHAFLAGLVDTSSCSLAQQQGLWATSSDRQHLSFKEVVMDGVLGVDSLTAFSSTPVIPAHRMAPSSCSFGYYEPYDHGRVVKALRWIPAEDYGRWTRVGHWLKAAYGDLAFDTWVDWSETASVAAKTLNDTGSYSYQEKWSSFSPYIEPGAGSGTLFLSARDEAVVAVNHGAKNGWCDRAQEAYNYLATYHPQTFADLTRGRVA